MDKPLLIVITGRPASGKSTLARLLADQMKLPLISRDELKEGFLKTTGKAHNESDSSDDWHVYETFFKTVELFVAQKISVIIEAAYQHRLWQPKLSPYSNIADLRIIICETSPDVAKARFNRRLEVQPGRHIYHGESAIITGRENAALLIDNYDNVKLEFPILRVDTTREYVPAISKIIEFINRPLIQ